MNCQEFETRLHPYVDGELGVDEIAAGDVHAAGCGSCRALAESERQFRDLLRRQPKESAPPELRARIRAASGRERRRATRAPWLVAPALAAAGLLLFLLVPGLVPRGPLDGGLVGSLVDKHIAYAQMEQPAEFVSTDSREVETWFRERVGLRVTVPDYSPAGIRLIGARLAAADERRVAYLLYQKGHVLMSVFMAPGRSSSLVGATMTYRGHQYLTEERKGYRTVSWSDGPVVFSLVSMLDWEALLECADRLRAERQREVRA
jgi:anti-sigma factor (TIGR02949 family)